MNFGTKIRINSMYSLTVFYPDSSIDLIVSVILRVDLLIYGHEIVNLYFSF